MSNRINLQVIGMGAAGGKATINLDMENILNKDDIFLINSTARDVPADYRELAYIYNTIGGAGKDVSFGKSLALHELEKETLGTKLNAFIKEDTDMVVINASTSGGTGAGGITVIADFIYKTIGIPVMIMLFPGFGEDARELRNTIEVFQGLNENYGIQTISNLKCLDGKDYIKAQHKANKIFAERIKTMMCKGIVDGDNNIDETDLYNTMAYPGYMTVETMTLPKLKDMNTFNEAITTLINNSVSLESDTLSTDNKKIAKRGIFINLKDEKEKVFVDFAFETLKEFYGVPYDTFTHIQFEKDQESYISVIMSGLEMPIKEIKTIEEQYKSLTSMVNKEKTNFFDTVKEMEGDEKDNQFNVRRRKRRNVSEETVGSDYIKSLVKKPDTDEIY